MNRIPLFAIEHSERVYRADFVIYGAALAGLATTLAWAAPPALRWLLVAQCVCGLAGWSLIEYGLHRHVLHGIEPFSRWHAEHHARPRALICAPTVLTAALFFVLVFVPVWAAAGVWSACAATFGVLTGYLGYAFTHHGVHHWQGRNRWLTNRKRWHALHHRTGAAPGHYGVTTGMWDRVFGTAGPAG